MSCPSCGHYGFTMTSCTGCAMPHGARIGGLHYHYGCNACPYRWVSVYRA